MKAYKISFPRKGNRHVIVFEFIAKFALYMRGHLYKYFSDRQWAEAFLQGDLLFRSLSYFRDYEDQDVRGDQNEGSAVYSPEDGLVITNSTQGKTSTLAGYDFEAAVKQEEIFVYCLSRSCSLEMRKRFASNFCVEILKSSVFCQRVASVLPEKTSFPGPKGYTRLGNRVSYYDLTEGGSPLWALPDKIAISKVNTYAWQNEFRLVFSLTDALEFEKVDTRLVPRNVKKVPNPAEHREYRAKTQSLSDICRLHEI